MNQAYLLIGGNIGEKSLHLRQTVALIEERAGRVAKKSALYVTPPWGKTDQPDFLNQALLVETELGPESLLKVLLHIETEMGRVREEKFGPRVIDIDIIFYNDLVYASPTLTIPHPLMQERLFVLEPMSEIAGAYVHPLLGETVEHLRGKPQSP